MSKESQEIACDFSELVIDPSPEAGERLWRRMHEYAEKYSRSLDRASPLLKLLFEAVEQAGIDAGWLDQYEDNKLNTDGFPTGTNMKEIMHAEKTCDEPASPARDIPLEFWGI